MFLFTRRLGKWENLKNCMNQYLYKIVSNNKNNAYLQYHAARYNKLLNLLFQYYTGKQRILDIGRSVFTEIAFGLLKTKIDTLGFEEDKETEFGFNYKFDLNNTQDPKNFRKDIPKYDIIILAEVIEHLHTSPKLVLSFIRSILKENGIVIIQTPNAVVAHKRIKMLFGYHPYALISEDILVPSHFREYTVDEVRDYCRHTGFEIEKMTFENYFDYRYRIDSSGGFKKRNFYRIINIFYRFLPHSFWPGLCFVVRSIK